MLYIATQLANQIRFHTFTGEDPSNSGSPSGWARLSQFDDENARRRTRLLLVRCERESFASFGEFFQTSDRGIMIFLLNTIQRVHRAPYIVQCTKDRNERTK